MELGINYEREDLGSGLVKLTQHLKPIAYHDGSIIRRIDNNWLDSGIGDRPHIVTAGPMMVSVATDGKRRIHPTRELDHYLEIGAPFIKPAATWVKVNLGSPARQNNTLIWTTANANLLITMAGHAVKLAVLLKGGWQPPNGQFAFPVDLVGLTRQGATVLANGIPVMRLAAPHVEDLDNPQDIRSIQWDFVSVSGQAYVLFTLPSLAGMSRPLVDPTLTLQPDATDGLDTEIEDGVHANTNRGTQNTIDAIYTGSTSRRGLYQFDLSTIPAGSVVSSAVFTLVCRATLSAAATVNIHRISQAWTEGGATWNKYDGSTNWASAGGDFDATISGQRIEASGFTSGSNYDFAIDQLVQDWVDATYSNLGLIAKVDTDTGAVRGLAAHSSDAATDTNRPKLVVIYTEPAGGLLPFRMRHHNRVR